MMISMRCQLPRPISIQSKPEMIKKRNVVTGAPSTRYWGTKAELKTSALLENSVV